MLIEHDLGQSLRKQIEVKFLWTQIEILLAWANFTFYVLMSTGKSFFKYGQCGQSLTT